MTFGGSGDHHAINDENRSGNAHNLSLTVTVVRALGSGAHGTVYLAEEAEEEEVVEEGEGEMEEEDPARALSSLSLAAAEFVPTVATATNAPRRRSSYVFVRS